MSKIIINPFPVNGDIATSLVIDLFYDYSSPTLRYYYTLYNNSGKDITAGVITQPKSTIPIEIENQLNIELLWDVNNITYLNNPNPTYTGSYKIIALPTRFRFELFDPVLYMYFFLNGRNDYTLLDASPINSVALSGNIMGILGVTGQLDTVEGILTDDGLNIETEDGRTIIIETPQTNIAGEDNTNITTEDNLNIINE